MTWFSDCHKGPYGLHDINPETGKCQYCRAAGERGDMQPKLTDDDHGEITVSLNGDELRGWSYESDSERRQKMLQAREYVEGWCDGIDSHAK